MRSNKKTAYLAAGCFWHAEYALAAQDGVTSTEVGYSDFRKGDSQGRVEVVKVEFDTDVTTFDNLIDTFWEIHNPSNPRNADDNYIEKSIIFTLDELQHQVAEDKFREKKSDDPSILTEILPFRAYKKAPEEDQKYYFKEQQRKGFS